MSSTAIAVTGLDSLTLNIVQEIHVKASREVVPRFGRWERPLLGDGAGDQAADAGGVCGAAVHVVPGGFECAVPVERDRRRDVDQVSSRGAGTDCGRTPERRDDRMGLDS